MGNGRHPGDGPRRGRGRRPREPKLLPPGCAYDDWRAVHVPALKRVLMAFERGAAEWGDYERRWKAHELAQDAGLRPEAPEPPSDAALLWGLLRATADVPADERAELVTTLQDRRRQAPWSSRTITTPDVVWWLTGEALAHGIACDYATPYQAWMALAELVLRRSDIGEIAVCVHGVVETRSPRLSADEVRALNADVARQERKLARKRRSAFGYRAD